MTLCSGTFIFPDEDECITSNDFNLINLYLDNFYDVYIDKIRSIEFCGIVQKKLFDNDLQMLPIEVAETVINDTDIDKRISNAVESQTNYYKTDGLCFQPANNKNVYDVAVLPINYNDMADFLTIITQDQLDTTQY